MSCCVYVIYREWFDLIFSFDALGQGRIKASAGPGAVPNAGPLQTCNKLTTPANCGPPKLRAVLQHP